MWKAMPEKDKLVSFFSLFVIDIGKSFECHCDARSCGGALNVQCFLLVLSCRFGGRKLSICSTNRTKLRPPQSNTRMPVRAKAKVSLTLT